MRKRVIRHRKQRTDDGKGFRRLVAGRRFRLPPDISSHEADRRFARIEDLWHDNEAFCHKTGRSAEWTRIALWAADFLRRGEMHVPFLRQEHPWRKQGLVLETSEADSWCGFVRPKSGVVGWWWLWPETVRLLDWWRALCEKKLRRGVEPNGRVLITETGAPLYRDESRNAQTGFANAWTRLLDRVQAKEGKAAIRRLPFGTMRNQLRDWLGGEQAKAVVASVPSGS